VQADSCISGRGVAAAMTRGLQQIPEPASSYGGPDVTRKNVGLVLLTMLSGFVAISGVVVDFTATHIYNPTWPPHARFHGYLSIARTVLIMAAVIVLIWGPVRAKHRFGWGVLGLLLLGWIAIWFIAPLVVPGTEERVTYIFAAALVPPSLIGLWLTRPGSRR